MKRLPIMSSFLLFLMLCASVTYWLMQWMAPATRPLVMPAQAERALPEMSAAANLFGGSTEAANPQGVKLTGIIHTKSANESIAIISLEGKPTRELKVGAEVSSTLVLKTIDTYSIVLLNNGVEQRISLSPLIHPK
jgi:general secretion pathway protein C